MGCQEPRSGLKQVMSPKDIPEAAVDLTQTCRNNHRAQVPTEVDARAAHGQEPTSELRDRWRRHSEESRQRDPLRDPGHAKGRETAASTNVSSNSPSNSTARQEPWERGDREPWMQHQHHIDPEERQSRSRAREKDRAARTSIANLEIDESS